MLDLNIKIKFTLQGMTTRDIKEGLNSSTAQVSIIQRSRLDPEILRTKGSTSKTEFNEFEPAVGYSSG